MHLLTLLAALVGARHWTGFDSDCIVPVLHGGVGNSLYQFSALLELAHRTRQRVCVVHDLWHHNRHIVLFRRWAGHPHPMAGVVGDVDLAHVGWCHLLEEIHCVPWQLEQHRFVARPLNDDLMYDVRDPSEFLPQPRVLRDRPHFLQGYYFNRRYHRKSRIAFAPLVRAETERTMGHWLRRGSAVCVHLRLVYEHEPQPNWARSRTQAHPSFYRRALAMFPSRRHRFLLFSDCNATRVHRFMHELRSPLVERLYRDGRVHVVDANPLSVVDGMRQCHHRVLTSSTLGVWGGLLAEGAGLTVLHHTFFVHHGRESIPDDVDLRWVVLE